MKLNLIIPAILLAGIAVSASTCTQEDRALFCTGAKVALSIGETHGYSAEEIARLRTDVETLCSFLSPAELQRAETAASAVAPVE